MDKLKRREEILRAARGVFATRGYHEAKVEDIAAAAKVAKGTVYLYFRDKRSIFEELVERVFVLLEGAILKVDVGSDVGSQVRHNIRAVVGVFLDDPTLPQLLLSPASGVDPELQAQMRKFMSTVHELLTTALQDGQRLGIVAAGDARLYATFAIGALKEVLIEVPRTKRSREEIVAALFDILSVGFLRVDTALTDPPVSKRGSVVRPSGH
jgi:AcrR family transcriptional regulator